MAKGKRTKGQTMIYKTLHRKQKIEQHEPHENLGRINVPEKGEQSLITVVLLLLKPRLSAMNEERTGF